MKKHPILLVDDEVNVLKSLTRIFQDDYEVFTALNAKEGLKILEEKKISLVISDQKMSGLNGLEFLEIAVKKYPDIIPIILTGHAELNDTIRAINYGCVYKFIIKPWNVSDLKLTVKRALEQYNLILKNRELTTKLKDTVKILSELQQKYPGIIKRPKDGIQDINLK